MNVLFAESVCHLPKNASRLVHKKSLAKMLVKSTPGAGVDPFK